MTPPTDDLVRWEVQDSVGVLTLDTAHKLNAFSLDLARQCLDILDVADADPDVRAIVLCGAGRAREPFVTARDRSLFFVENDDRAAAGTAVR